jgi:hypothetical protein
MQLITQTTAKMLEEVEELLREPEVVEEEEKASSTAQQHVNTHTKSSVRVDTGVPITG